MFFFFVFFFHFFFCNVWTLVVKMCAVFTNQAVWITKVHISTYIHASDVERSLTFCVPVLVKKCVCKLFCVCKFIV